MDRQNRPSLRLATVLLATCAFVAPTLGRADQPAPVTVHPDSVAPSAAPVTPAPDEADARRKADREAFIAARLAFLHAGLALTADQDSLWPPVEAALRSFAATHAHRHHHEDGSASRDGVGSSSNDALKRRAERLIRKGEAIKSLAEATAPLLKSLSDDQKSRLPRLLHGGHGVIAQAFDLRQDGSDHDGWRQGRRDGGDRGREVGGTEGDGWRGHRGQADRDRDDRRGYAERDGDRDQAGQDDGDQGPPMHRHHHHQDDERAEPMALRS